MKAIDFYTFNIYILLRYIAGYVTEKGEALPLTN